MHAWLEVRLLSMVLHSRQGSSIKGLTGGYQSQQAAIAFSQGAGPSALCLWHLPKIREHHTCSHRQMGPQQFSRAAQCMAIIRPSRPPAAHPAARSLNGTPALARASTTALMAATRVPPSACKTWAAGMTGASEFYIQEPDVSNLNFVYNMVMRPQATKGKRLQHLPEFYIQVLSQVHDILKVIVMLQV
eukprot:1159689-Pelagomonas_calceolata.AAC.3